MNFVRFVDYSFNHFDDMKDYWDLFHFLRSALAKQRYRSKDFLFPTSYITKNNVIHICRILFRSMCGNLGIMIPEGNGRNYATALALTRCRDIDVFLNKPIPRDKALSTPNLSYIRPQIECKYMMHPHDKEGVSSDKHPYKGDVKAGYISASQKSYANAQSSTRLSCSELAVSFFNNKVANNALNKSCNLQIPIELSNEWPNDIKQQVKKYFFDLEVKMEKAKEEANKTKNTKKAAKKEKDRNEDDKTERFVAFLMRIWLLKKKKAVFVSICNCAEILAIIKSDHSHLMKGWVAERTQQKISEKNHLVMYFSQNYVENISHDLFGKMNMVHTLGTLLGGLSIIGNTGEKQEDWKLMNALRYLIVTNGKMYTQIDDDLYTDELVPVHFKRPSTDLITSNYQVSESSGHFLLYTYV
jgi:ribosomal protein S14